MTQRSRKLSTKSYKKTLQIIAIIMGIVGLVLIATILWSIKIEQKGTNVNSPVQFLYTSDVSEKPTEDVVVVHEASGNSVQLTGTLMLPESNTIRTVGVSRVEREQDTIIVSANVSTTDAIGDTSIYPWVEVYIPIVSMNGINKVIFQWYSLNSGPLVQSQNDARLLRTIEREL